MRYQMIFQAIYLAKTRSINTEVNVANSVEDLWRILRAKRLGFPKVFGLGVRH